MSPKAEKLAQARRWQSGLADVVALAIRNDRDAGWEIVRRIEGLDTTTLLSLFESAAFSEPRLTRMLVRLGSRDSETPESDCEERDRDC